MNTDYFRDFYNTIQCADGAWRGWHNTSSKYMKWIYDLGKFDCGDDYTKENSLVDDGSIQKFFDDFEIQK